MEASDPLPAVSLHPDAKEELPVATSKRCTLTFLKRAILSSPGIVTTCAETGTLRGVQWVLPNNQTPFMSWGAATRNEGMSQGPEVQLRPRENALSAK